MRHVPRTTKEVALCVILAISASLVWAGTALGATSALYYTGNAYGSYANVGSTIIAGKTSVVGVGCQTQAGKHVGNTAASVAAAPVISTGAITTTGDSADDGTVLSSAFTADVHDLDLLSGLITATEVKAASTTTQDGTGLHVSSAGSTLVNLVVGGTAITAVPAPNTVLSLSVNGQVVGTVTLNEQTQHISGAAASLTVNMIHVKLTADIPGVAAAGTNIVVAHATSDLELNKGGSLDGVAYGTKAAVGTVALSGPTA